MKTIFRTLVIVLLILITADCAYSQTQDNLRASADTAISRFTWKIQKSGKGMLMVLDVPFTRENQNRMEFISLAVAKVRSNDRPGFISITIPNNILKSNGLLITFANNFTSANGEKKIDLEKGLRLNFEKCDDSNCTVKMKNGYVVDQTTNSREDILRKFLDSDQLLVLIVYPDKSHKTIMVPLFAFKKQYAEL